MNRHQLRNVLILIALLAAVAMVMLVMKIRPSPSGSGASSASPSATAASPGTLVVVENLTTKDTVAYLTFGSDSKALPTDKGWEFCTTTRTAFACTFPMAASVVSPKKLSEQWLPIGGKYLNATISFGAPVTCGVTKGEVNVNNPSWYDTTDVSLVDGYSNDIMILVSADYEAGVSTRLGPPLGATGNEKVFGLYPAGCDICTGRQAPPCGYKPGDNKGCKAGTQYKPDVPCQYQGIKKGGGDSVVRVMLVVPVPA